MSPDTLTQQQPPLCYVRHPATGQAVEIHRGESGYHPTGTKCSPERLNAKLPHPPTPEQVLAMRHGSLMGWNTMGADPAFWVAPGQEGAR